MRELLFLSAIFAILAVAGINPGHANTAKFCAVSSLTDFIGERC